MLSKDIHAEMHKLRTMLTAARRDVAQAENDPIISQDDPLMLGLREKAHEIWRELEAATKDAQHQPR